jgi:hypothetical protein
MNHIMLDIETLGTGSHAAIMSIGAVKFDPSASDLTIDGVIHSFYIPINLKSALKYGSVNADTIEWWFNADQTFARETWLSEPKIDLDEALLAFADWYGDNPNVPVWGNGAPFDNVILRNAYTATGIDCPCSFRADSCFRTLKSQVLPPVDPPELIGAAHHALDDAMHQARWMQKIVNYRHLVVK